MPTRRQHLGLALFGRSVPHLSTPHLQRRQQVRRLSVEGATRHPRCRLCRYRYPVSTSPLTILALRSSSKYPHLQRCPEVRRLLVEGAQRGKGGGGLLVSLLRAWMGGGMCISGCVYYY